VATTITVSAGATQTAEATAPVAASLGGAVFAYASARGFDGDASAMPWTVNPGTGQWEPMLGTTVNGGTYDFRELIPGTYRVQFHAYSDRYLDQYWKFKPDIASADSITLAAGESTTTIDGGLRAIVGSDTIAGENRMETAVVASERLYPDAAHHADAVVLTTGYNWPDALGASALAGVAKAPVLLTYKGERALTATVSAEVERLKADGATEAYVLGDEKAVGTGAFNELVAAFGPTHVHRLSGAGRYETSLKIAAEVRAKASAWEGKVLLAKGTDFPDALAAAPLAAKRGWPIVLAEGDGHGGLSARVKSYLSTNATAGVVLLGDEKSLPKTVEDSAKSAIGSAALDRWAGSNRIETSLIVAGRAADAGMSYANTGFATGWGYADALCGGPYLAGLNAPLLLTKPVMPLGQTMEQGLADLSPAVETATFLGGTATISQPVRDDIVDRLQ
jgi:putative cell wall-binding protein